MTWFRNAKMASKLGVSFAVLTILVALVGVLGVYGLGRVNDCTEEVAKHADGLNHLQEANVELLQISRAVRNAILDDDAAAVDKRAAEIRKSDANFRTEFEAYRQTIAKDDVKVKAVELERQFNELRPFQDEIVALAREKKNDEAKARLPKVRVIADSIDGKINAMVVSKQELMKQSRAEARETYAQIRWVVAGCILGACALAIALGVLLSRLTVGPLVQTMGVLDAMSKGDLTQRAEASSKDEFGQLATALNMTLGILQTGRERDADNAGQIAAIGKAQAVIEFKLDGTIVTANQNFLSAVGYSLPEIQGRHHSMFVEAAFASSSEYRDFWARLNRGEYVANEFKRIGKGGKEVWIQASYNPIFDLNRKPYKVIKYATDITATKNMERKVKEDAAELQQKVAAIVTAVSALAAGDFTQQAPDLGTDAVGQMANSLNKAIVSVRTALEGVREVSEQLADASGQLASASEEISTGAQEQASSLEETSSTLEEITSTVKQNADNAQQARQLASGSREIAEKGGQVVGTAVEAMSEINASSKKIAEIITAIDEIAFQTNLLALNAAVEAARAGEQGRGFAVVASEVRNLAQRSATAAKEIKSLINDSVRKVDAGTELVNRSGATLAEIVTSVKRVTDIVTEIAAAGKEQSTGIEQVNKAVSQMDTVTQRNASQTEEMSATAQTLTDQAAQLRDLVGRFKLCDRDGGRPAAPAPTKRSKSVPTTKPRPAVARALKNGHAHDLDRMGGREDDGFTEF